MNLVETTAVGVYVPFSAVAFEHASCVHYISRPVCLHATSRACSCMLVQYCRSTLLFPVYIHLELLTTYLAALMCSSVQFGISICAVNFAATVRSILG